MRCWFDSFPKTLQDDAEDVPDGAFLTRVLMNCGESAGIAAGIGGTALPDGLLGIQVAL